MATSLIAPTALALLLLVPGAAGAAPGDQMFGNHLTGAEEVPARETQAQGQATFRVNADETKVDYKLMATNIDNVVAAHIHCAAKGVPGPIIQFLYGPASAGGGRQSGILAQGSFATPGGTCAGTTFMDAMRSGLAYVNVHTNDGDATQNEGPGDFPSGEIRCQIAPRGVA